MTVSVGVNRRRSRLHGIVRQWTGVRVTALTLVMVVGGLPDTAATPAQQARVALAGGTIYPSPTEPAARQASRYAMRRMQRLTGTAPSQLTRSIRRVRLAMCSISVVLPTGVRLYQVTGRRSRKVFSIDR